METKLYRQKPLLVEAVQWFKFGDHPDVVPGEQNQALVKNKGLSLSVAAGDWIIRDLDGDLYVCRPEYFEKHFQPTEQSYNLHEVKFETFMELGDAQEYRSVYGGYLIKGNDCYVVCDEERAIELLCLRPLRLLDAKKIMRKLQVANFDETKI